MDAKKTQRERRLRDEPPTFDTGAPVSGHKKKVGFQDPLVEAEDDISALKKLAQETGGSSSSSAPPAVVETREPRGLPFPVRRLC